MSRHYQDKEERKMNADEMIKVAIEELESNYQRTLCEIRKSKARLEVSLACCKKFGLTEPSFYPDIDRSARISINKPNSFMEVLPVLEYLEENGHEIRHSFDGEDATHRIFVASDGIDVIVFVSDDGENCKRVEDGTKLNYKIVCN